MKVSILGTRGIPARHGGFETFAEHLALYLTSRGHQVTVYCQTSVRGEPIESEWRGVRLVTFYGRQGAGGTIDFDWSSVKHAASEAGIILTLGYNTAVFSLIYLLRGKVGLMNMDGIEWKREKWTDLQRAWLLLNEFLGARLSKALIADHPEIERHLQRWVRPDKIFMIPYEAEAILSADVSKVVALGLEPGRYGIVIARPEPENSLLEIVRAFSSKDRDIKLVVLGSYKPEISAYHRSVLEAAGSEVVFLGGIYEKPVVEALRFFATFYVHGHRVGGTNPSLVEAMAAANPVIANDNRFTAWVTGPEQEFFCDEDSLKEILERLLADPDRLREMSSESRKRYLELFTPDEVLSRYEKLLLQFYPKPG